MPISPRYVDTIKRQRVCKGLVALQYAYVKLAFGTCISKFQGLTALSSTDSDMQENHKRFFKALVYPHRRDLNWTLKVDTVNKMPPFKTNSPIQTSEILMHSGPSGHEQSRPKNWSSVCQLPILSRFLLASEVGCHGAPLLSI